MIEISSMVWTYSTLSQQVQRLSIIKAQYRDSTSSQQTDLGRRATPDTLHSKSKRDLTTPFTL